MDTLRWHTLTSMLKTLAAKHQSTVSKMAAKYKAKIQTPDGPRICFEARVHRNGKPDLVARFGGIPLKRNKDAVLIDRADLWIASTDGTIAPRKITTGKNAESGYTWSPNGNTIAFTAKREGDEAAQIYLLNMKSGGEAQRFTNIYTGASSPQWSADGSKILFTSKVFPGAFSDSANKKIAEEKKKQKYKARVYTGFPIRNFDVWLDNKQTHVFVQPIDSTTAVDAFTRVSAVTKEGFSFSGVCWGPNNNSLIFAASTDANTAAYQEPTTNLYSLNLQDSNGIQLTSDGADYGAPQLSNDGKYLVCYATANNNYKVYNLNKLTRFDYPSMQNKTLLTPSLDRPVNGYTIKNNTILLSVEDQGNDKLFSMPVAGGALKSITNMRGSFSGISASADAGVIISNYENAVMPAVVVKISGGTIESLTHFNDEKLKTLDLPAVEEIWFTSSRGKKIRSLLVRPAGFDSTKKYPLFVVMHGGPAGAWKENWGYRWNQHLLAAPGYVLLLTDYTGSTGYGEKFAQDIQYDPFKGPADEINEAAADAIKRFSFIDGSRQAAGGGSYGGHLANWMEATTSHYKCLLSHAGLVNSEAQFGTSDVIWQREVMNGGAPWTQTKTWKEQNPIRYAARFKTPMMVTVGENDFRVPINNSLENWSALQRMKVPSKLLVFPDENHWILNAENSRFWYSEVHAWLKKYL